VGTGLFFGGDVLQTLGKWPSRGRKAAGGVKIKKEGGFKRAFVAIRGKPRGLKKGGVSPGRRFLWTTPWGGGQQNTGGLTHHGERKETGARD